MRNQKKALILAISATLFASGSVYAQEKGVGNGVEPSGPSTGGTLMALPGQTCSGSGGSNCSAAIADSPGPSGNPGAATNSSMDFDGCEIVGDVNVGIDTTHTWVGDLIYTVTAPDATAVTIIERPGGVGTQLGCSGGNIFAALEDDAATPVESECAMATPTIGGTFSPNNPLAAFNGLSANGTWQLSVTDNANIDIGSLNDWSLEVACDEPQFPDEAIFTVNKNFTDGNTGGVEVTLNCFDGLPIRQEQTITEAQNVEFTVHSFEQGELDCNVTEADTLGYTGSYDDGDGVSAVNCSWQGLTGGDYTCNITNSPDSVEVVINKEWVLDRNGQGGGNVLDPGYSVTLWCNNPIDNGSYNGSSYYRTLYNGTSNGTNDVPYSAFVTPKWDVGTNCNVVESPFDSAVESHNGCTALHVELAEGDECTIVNTVFFEGIPSLNQYGLAILALLMLGVGFVGFRRFV
jgi:subtilisin-like proprotein convertase family protein